MPDPSPTLATMDSADSGWSRPDDRFIPVRACDLSRRLASDVASYGLDPEAFRQFALALEDVIDRETGTFERRLGDAYARFNPDRDTQPPYDFEPPAPGDYEILRAQIDFLLDKANYEELSDVEITRAVLKAKSRNLTVRVDPSRVEFLRLWVRGRGETTRRQRCAWRPWKHEVVEVPLYKRLVVLARLKNDPHVILKLFKDIPEADVEALLPHAEVTMSLWDRIKLLSTGAGTLGVTVSKLLKIAIGFAALWKLAWILLIGLGTLGIRAALGYRSARINRDWQRTRHLYFQNMGNNASALQLLVAKVKQEEFKETLLIYVACHALDSSAGSQALCDWIELYLAEQFDAKVDFDIKDAQRKLEKLGLRPAGEGAEVLSVGDATAVLRGAGREVRMLEVPQYTSS
ncbi:DUF3754 domain-containing protein [Aeoliella sp. SH292]|uniref:DUF3754 domain-containing protein n=1 Tax=Aeoliella sp. SH292 TaxID=3454464 RepID=UPI003F9A743E